MYTQTHSHTHFRTLDLLLPLHSTHTLVLMYVHVHTHIDSFLPYSHTLSYTHILCTYMYMYYIPLGCYSRGRFDQIQRSVPLTTFHLKCSSLKAATATTAASVIGGRWVWSCMRCWWVTLHSMPSLLSAHTARSWIIRTL